MSNFNIRVNGAANLTQMKTEFAKLTTEVDALNAAMERSVIVQNKVNPKGYAQMAQAVKVGSQVTRDAALSTGMFEVQQLKLNSATEAYTEAIQKQKLGLKSLWNEFRNGSNVRKAAYKEQLALQQMMVQQMPGSAGGKKVFDVYIPNEVNKSFDTLGKRIGFVSEELKSASTQMINWGKNTQWAGRQLMVGFTMPVALFGAAAATMTYQVDQQLTRIRKVYDTTASQTGGDIKQMAAANQELARLSTDAMSTARNVANQYGQSITDTLAVQAELAATGEKGLKLQQATMETMRIATLGELDTKTATTMTVALQSAFGKTIKTTQDLSDAFNFMNATENATSLSINDIAEAVPRAGSAMAALGVNVKEMTVLLTAMKESGVDAAEGANALKSATGSILKPSPTALKTIDALTQGRIDVEEISKATNGNLLSFMKELASQMSGIGMGAYEMQQVLLNLFGKYQFSRVSALFTNLSKASTELANNSPDAQLNQTAKAWKLLGNTAQENADIANGEITQIQNSLSGRLRRAIEGAKAELAEMGKPFLEVGVSIITVIGKIIKAFNSLPGGVKKGLAVGAIITATVGPLIMLTGLAANFAGNIVKMGASLLGLAGNLKIISKDSKAAQLATELVNKGFVSETTALQQLTAEMRLMTQATKEGALAQKQFMLANNQAMQFTGGIPVGMAGVNPSRISNLSKISRSQPIVAGNGPFSGNLAAPTGTRVIGAGHVISSTKAPIVDEESPKNARETSKWLASGAVSAGLMTASMIGMSTSSDGLVHNLSEFALIAATAAPLFSGMAAGIKAIQWNSILGATTRFRTGIANAAISSGLLLKNLGSRGGVGFEMRNAVGAVGRFGKGIGSAAVSVLSMVSPIGWIGIALGAGVAALALWEKHTNEAANHIKEMYSDAEGLSQILGYVQSNSLTDTVDSNGNASSGIQSKAEQFAEKYKNVTKAIKETTTEQEAFNIAMAQGLKVIQTDGTAEQAKEAVEIALQAAKGKAEKDKIIMHFKPEMDFSNIDNIVNAGISVMNQAIERANKAKISPDDSAPSGLSKWMNKHKAVDWIAQTENEGAYEEIKAAAGEAGKAAGKAFTTALDNNVQDANVALKAQQILDGINKELDSNDKRSQAYYAAQIKKEEFLKGLVSGKVTDANAYVKSLKDGADIFDIMSGTSVAIVDSSGQTVTNMDDLKTAATGSAVGAKNLSDNLGNAKTNAEGTAAALKDINLNDAFKTGLKDTQDQIAEQVDNTFTAKMQKSIDAYKAAQDKRLDVMKSDHDAQDTAFENRWDRRKKAVENMYDAQIQKTKDAIDAEKKADDIRQKIFQAEITRMQRLADAQNTNIDFNVALNAGNLDEAAKIQNDAIAQQTEWALSDVGDAEASKSQKKQDRLAKKEDRISKAKDNALDVLAKQEKAAKDSLDRRQKMEEQALQDEITANEHAQKRIWDIRKKNVDKAIKLFKEYVPTNEKDLAAHVAAVSKQYEDFNLKTTSKFNTTSKVVGNMLKENVLSAARSLESDIQWAAVGEDVAKKFIRGAFGMSPDQFQSWMQTGVMPDKASLGGAGKHKTKINNLWGDANGKPIYHTGGIVGVDKGGRAGIRAGHPDEVPATLLKGEGVLNRKAMGALGPDGFRALNAGNSSASNKGYGTGGGGLVGLGLVGIMGTMMKAAMRNMTGSVLTRAAGRANTNFRAAQAGTYGNIDFSSEQLSNASTIASVGKSLGMSSRDIEIGIMTAITESGLRNLHGGDRDSQGLFQQRPSQGWGTVEQVTNPTYAATKFFNALKGIEDRANMSPWLAAQAVQRSAFADGSNYEKYWDNAQAIFNGMAGGSGVAGAGFVSGSGGWHKASVAGKGWGNSHDYHNGPGSPLYAASDGTVVDSRAITSGGSPGNGVFTAPNGQPYRSYGETIAIRTASGDILRYAHLSPGKRYVNAGQQVKGGSLIGLSGWTGNATGPHTHFDVNGDYNAKGWMDAHGISLSKGAQNIKWDNTIANLHKGEAVLTEDINNQFRKGVKRFAEGPDSQYNLYMTVNGANLDEDKLAAKTMTAIRRHEQRKPQSRSGS